MQLTDQQLEEIKDWLETLWGLGPGDRFFEAAGDGRSLCCMSCGQGGEWTLPAGDDQMAYFWALNQLFKTFIPHRAYEYPGI